MADAKGANVTGATLKQSESSGVLQKLGFKFNGGIPGSPANLEITAETVAKITANVGLKVVVDNDGVLSLPYDPS